MGMFNKILASIGIGAARVDTVVYTPTLHPGTELRGHIDIKGGEVVQRIDNIYIYVMTKCEKEVNDNKVLVKGKVQIVNIPVSKDIQPSETLQIPFSFILDKNAPMSSPYSPLWIHTGLDIHGAIDPKDKDMLNVMPHPYIEVVLGAVEELGFTIRDIGMKKLLIHSET